jgi:hypothetical protein
LEVGGHQLVQFRRWEEGGRRRREEGGRRKEKGERRKKKGGRRKEEEGRRRKEEGGRRKEEGGNEGRRDKEGGRRRVKGGRRVEGGRRKEERRGSREEGEGGRRRKERGGSYLAEEQVIGSQGLMHVIGFFLGRSSSFSLLPPSSAGPPFPLLLLCISSFLPGLPLFLPSTRTSPFGIFGAGFYRRFVSVFGELDQNFSKGFECELEDRQQVFLD